MTNYTINMDTINDNRLMSTGLVRDDFTTNEQYRAYCEDCVELAKTCYDSVTGTREEYIDQKTVEVDAIIRRIATACGLELPAISLYRARFILATLGYKKYKSAEYKKAEERISTFRKSVAVHEEDGDEDMLKKAQESLAKWEVERDSLKEKSGHYYNIYKMNAPKMARKRIEDLISDIATEREFMTAQQIIAEQEAKKAERRAKSKAKNANK